MKRRFTSLLALAVLLGSSGKVLSQSGCLTGGSFPISTTYTFNSNAQDFSGDFSWSANGSGQLESSQVSVGQTKILKTATMFLPNTASTIAWSFDLSGTANVSTYTVDAIYSNGSGTSTVPVCTGGALTTTGSNLVFAAVAPAQIVGTNFRLQITFNSTSTGNKNLVVDNFSSNANAAAAPLPVTFSFFSAKAATGAISLTWLVASEINVNRYEVERSGNGKTFSKIGSVAASASTTYTYLDAAYSTGSNYYRLKAVDNDGKYKYSTVVLFKVGKNTLLSTLKTYPVPATNELTVLHDEAVASSMISILSVDGKMLKTVKPLTGMTETSINISSLKSGLYLVRYSISETESITTKLVKQ